MIENVKKRDGRIIIFSKDKIARAIFLAANEVAQKEGKTADYGIAEKLSDKALSLLTKKYIGQVPTVENVQDAVVKTLIKNGHARTSEAYILYRAERSRIRNSKTRLIQSIKEITFSDAHNADIKRENANIDGNTAMGTMLQYGSAVSKEFCKEFVINPNHSKAHDAGDIHIHDMDFLNMGTLTCCQIDIAELFKNGFSTGHGHLREPQDILSYSALAAIAIQSNQNDQHGGQSIPFFDYGMAKGVKKTFKRSYIENIYKAISIEKDIEEDQLKIIIGIVNEIEKSLNKEIALTIDTEINDKIKQEMIRKYDLDEEKCSKIQKFANKEALRETNRKTYQAMEAFIHNLNTMHSRAGAQVPFSSVNFGTDTSEEGRMVSKNLLLSLEKGLGNGETAIFPILIFKVKEGINLNKEDINYDLFKLACKVSSKRLFPNFSFIDAPFNLQYYKEGHPETEATYMG